MAARILARALEIATYDERWTMFETLDLCVINLTDV